MLVLALVAVIDWMLVVCILSIATASEGEEWYVGEEFAGEDQGQPGITGKPPLALASLLSYIAMHMLWFTKLHYSVGEGAAPALRHYSVDYHPYGCSH